MKKNITTRWLRNNHLHDSLLVSTLKNDSFLSFTLTTRIVMLQWAVIFFIIAIIAAVFGYSGLAHDTANIAKILAVIGIILAILSFAFHRRSSRD